MKNSKIKYIKENLYLIYLGLMGLLSIIGFLCFYSIANNIMIMHPEVRDEIILFRNLAVIFNFILILIALLLIYSVRKTVVDFTNKVSNIIQDMIDNKQVEFETTKETITSKIENKLKLLLEILEVKNKANKEEKEAIQSLIGDIAHQVNTPIANISMYNQILIDRDVDKDKQKEFLRLIKTQVSKLEWLIQSLLKMSRLETGAIAINKSKVRVYEVLANALSGIYLKANKKNIEIKVNCDEHLELKLDKKWTTEALFNVIDNSVKYSNENSIINIDVVKWDMFTKVDIIDKGLGIDEKDINNVFKRFYRSEDVSDIEGVGVGLFLVREIITKQGGFIKVKSTRGEGSCFSIFLPN